MISIDLPSHRFQLRAAAIVIDDDFVLLHRPEGELAWALPGGRVEAGEDARTCLVREFGEELGEPVDCGGMLHVVENFFVVHGRPHHEIGLYFDVTLRAGSPLLDKTRHHAGIEGERRLEFRWFATGRLHCVELRPAALRAALVGPGQRFQHLIQRD
jgi:8-oxo-dGTP pyrophosphatase MutT (NUDIX family)